MGNVQKMERDPLKIIERMLRELLGDGEWQHATICLTGAGGRTKDITVSSPKGVESFRSLAATSVGVDGRA